jgi:hypothetical protein
VSEVLEDTFNDPFLDMYTPGHVEELSDSLSESETTRLTPPVVIPTAPAPADTSVLHGNSASQLHETGSISTTTQLPAEMAPTGPLQPADDNTPLAKSTLRPKALSRAPMGYFRVSNLPPWRGYTESLLPSYALFSSGTTQTTDTVPYPHESAGEDGDAKDICVPGSSGSRG